MKITLLTLALISVFSFSVNAHEGHNHGPGQVQPTKGGVVLKAKKFFLEVVGTNSLVMFYPLKKTNPKSQVLSAIPLNEVKLSATFKLPRGHKKESIKLSAHGDHFMGSIDAKKSHRYEVVVDIVYAGEVEQLTFQIEPQE